MYLYGSSASPELLMNEMARDFYSFGMLHLTCTMFITTETGDPRQGIFHRILDPRGLSYLLAEVDRTLDSPLGNTTLRQFVRSKRNKLATHGTLAFSSQPLDVQAVTHNELSVERFHEAMEGMLQAVLRLERELARVESQAWNPQPAGAGTGSSRICLVADRTSSAAGSRRLPLCSAAI